MQETTLAVQENSTEELLLSIPTILDSAPEILMRNQSSFDKALSVFEQLEALITEKGMNDVYDQQLSKFINQCGITIASMNERRTPVTQLLTRISKQYTSLESEVKDLKDKGQTYRNNYATKKINERKETERIANENLEKEKETIKIKQNLKVLYGVAFSNYISSSKSDYMFWFNKMTLEYAKGQAKQEIQKINYKLNTDQLTILLTDWTLNITRLTLKEKETLDKEIKASLLPEFTSEYEAEMLVFRQDLKDTLPSKIKELETLSLADEEETKRLLAAQKKREEEEAEKLKIAEAKRNEESVSNAAVAAMGESAAATVDATLFEEAPKVAESYEIKLSNNANYLMLIQFWFEKEGKTLTSEKLEAFTIKRIKSFCEGYAVKNNEFVKGVGITYEPKYKAK